MKRFLKATAFLLALTIAFPAAAFDFMVDGICYNINADGTSVTVTYQYPEPPAYYELEGEKIIPATVNHSGKDYPVTAIDNNAFKNCTGLTSVSIPNSVISIGVAAFRGCSKMTSASFVSPSSVKTIGPSSFRECGSLKSIEIPNSVTSIGYLAFYCCSGLTSVTIPNSVTEMDSESFENCYNIETLNIDNNKYASISYFRNSSPKNLILGSSVTSIGNGAFFNCNRLTSVTIPKSVTEIGAAAFSSCSGLTSIIIPSSVTSIGAGAFHYCSKLSSISIPDALEDIGYEAFDETAWYNGKTDQSLVYIGKVAYKYKGEMPSGTAIKIQDGTIGILVKCFYNNTNLKSVTIPNTVKKIGDNAFYNCRGLTSITVPSSVTKIGDWTFGSCGGLKTVKWNAINCEYSGEHRLFDQCFLIQSFTFGGGIKRIPSYLCQDLNSLELVTIPNTVEEINTGAFKNCSNLKSVTNLAETPQLIDPNVFSGVNISNCSLYVLSQSFPQYSATDVWKDFIIEEFNPYLKYTKNSDNTALIITGYEDEMPSTLTIPASIEGLPVTSIGESAFEGCTILTSVTIPNSVTSIGNKAFRKCSNLKTANIPSSVTSIGSAAFSNCTALTTVSIPDKVTKINNSTFYNCNSLKSIAIPNSVTSIGDSAFELCSGLTSATIPNSVKTLGRYAFYKCSGLKSVNISNSVTEIGKSAFYGCAGLTSVDIPNSVVTIGERAFYECSNLASVTLSDKLSKVSNYTFYHCSSLKSVTIPNSVAAVDSCAFSGCKALSSLTIGNSVKKFDYSAFSNCTSLKTVVIPGSVTEIGRSAFYMCSGLESVEIPNSAKTIGLYAFYNCSSLTSITNHATTPQTINANVFTGVDKTKCKLNVWHESVDKYKKAEVWKDFLINDLGGVEGVEADAAAKEVEGYYDLRGIRLAEPSRGQVVIVRYTDGTARKIIVE